MSDRTHDQDDDAFLVGQTTDGVPGAFELLVNRYYRRIGAMIFQKLGRVQDAEDLAQETFTKAYLSITQLKEPSRFGPWLYRIANMTVIDFLRRKKLRKSASIDEMKESDYEVPSNPGSDIEPDTFDTIMKALAELPEDYRLAVTLRYLDHMTAKDIAEHLGEPHGTIRNRLFRANAMLRKKLEGLM